MFSKPKRRIVLAIMLMLIFVLAATLGIIYSTTDVTVKNENKEMLQLFADSYYSHGMPLSSPGGAQAPMDPEGDLHLYQLTTFYAVSFDEDGTALELLNDTSSYKSDEELIAYAKSLMESGKSYGIEDKMAYLVTTQDGITLVSIMDNAVTDNTFHTLIRNFFIFGGIAIFVMFVFSYFLARWVVQPMKMGYEKQQQFVSDAGHELKTPISTINANAEILKRQLQDNVWLDNIIYENQRMSVMVHQLLDLARIESNSVVFSEVELSRLATATALAFEASAFEKQLTYSYEIQPDLKVMGDASSLEKLLSILLDNAISHCNPNGAVQFLLKREKGQIHLRVSNDGSAIEEEQMKHLFDRFYKQNNDRCEDKDHYGLGLAIAKSIVDLHKGKIEVFCDKEKVIFCVSLGLQN